MKLVLDMNLPPRWAAELISAGHDAVHWSLRGPADASDAEVLAHVATTGSVLLTHDLDFGSILASGGAPGPSVVIIRADLLASNVIVAVTRALAQFEDELASGALLVLDAKRTRVRLLPLQ